MMTSVHVTCIIRCPHLYQKQQSPQAPSRRPYAVAMLRRSPCTSDPHTGHVPIRFHGFSIQPPKILTLVSTRPAASLRKPTRPANPLKSPGGHGHGVASRCDDGVDRGAGMSWSGLWPGSPGNRGRLDSAKVRRRGAGSAGRMTDHAGQARRHACATPLGYRVSTFLSISCSVSLIPFSMPLISFSLSSLSLSGLRSGRPVCR